MIFNISGGGSGGTGAAMTVMAPMGVTVTISKDGKSKTKIANSSGVAVFKGLSTGMWTVTITDGEQTSAQKMVTITADYEESISFFSATINVTYPAGSTCTATDGVTTISAPDTSGTWACVVPNSGTWTVSCTNGSKTNARVVEITENGQIISTNLAYRLYLFESGVGNSNGYKINPAFNGAGYAYSEEKAIFATDTSQGNSLWFDPKVDTSDYTRLCVDLVCYARYSSSNSIKIGVGQDIPTSITNPGNFEAYMSNIFSTNRETYCVNIDSVNQEEYVKIYAFGVTGEIYNVWLE